MYDIINIQEVHIYLVVYFEQSAGIQELFKTYNVRTYLLYKLRNL